MAETAAGRRFDVRNSSLIRTSGFGIRIWVYPWPSSRANAEERRDALVAVQALVQVLPDQLAEGLGGVLGVDDVGRGAHVFEPGLHEPSEQVAGDQFDLLPDLAVDRTGVGGVEEPAEVVGDDVPAGPPAEG